MFDSVDITLGRHQLEWGAGPGWLAEGSLSQMLCKLMRLGRPRALVHGKTVAAKGQLGLYSRRETRAGWGGSRLGRSPGVEPSSLPLPPLNLGRDSWPGRAECAEPQDEVVRNASSESAPVPAHGRSSRRTTGHM